jgi:hypothetical protein
LQVFEFFDVSDFIAYSTFNTLCERTINELGEVRGAVLQLVNPGQVVSNRAITEVHQSMGDSSDDEGTETRQYKVLPFVSPCAVH